MDFDLSADQELFLETTRKFIEAECPLTAVRALADDPVGFDRTWWQRGAELGWTSSLVPEALGGGSVSEAGLLDLVLVAEEFGRMVSPGPLVPVNVVASALARHGSPEQQAAHLPGLLDGTRVAAWAFAEERRRWEPNALVVEATPLADGFALTGAKTWVEAGAQADLLLVTARSGEGLVQLLVPVDSPGVEVTPLESLDLVRRFAQVRFDDVRLPRSARLGEPATTAAAVEEQLQVALALLAAESVGAVDRVFAFTLEWGFDRFSFGRPLASYQALKHRFADMKMWLEACHATATASARAVATGGDQAGELARVAKAYIGDHAPEIVQDCVQLHGGIGVTWDHDLHLYLRRVTVDRAMYGGPAEHRRHLAGLLGLP